MHKIINQEKVMQIIICLTFMTFSFLLSSSSFGKSTKDLVLREGIYYEKFSDQPFSGEVFSNPRKDKSGKIKYEWLYKGNFLQGKKEGKWEWYEPTTGQLLTKGFFKKVKKTEIGLILRMVNSI